MSQWGRMGHDANEAVWRKIKLPPYVSPLISRTIQDVRKVKLKSSWKK